MKWQLIDEWREVLKKSWSIRLIVVAGALSGLEVLLPQIGDHMPVRPFSILAVVVTAAAVIARLIAQASIMKGPPK
jgi:hypothetical protein